VLVVSNIEFRDTRLWDRLQNLEMAVRPFICLWLWRSISFLVFRC
jgi:hypothetical protein